MSQSKEKRETFNTYLWTLSYFKPQWALTLMYVLFGGGMIWGELMIPRKMGALIDETIPLKDMSLLKWQVVGLLGIVGGILLCKGCYTYLEGVISGRITKHQQRDLLEKLHQLGYAYYEKVPTGKILALFENAVQETQKTYTFLFPHFVYSLVQFSVPSILLLRYQPMFFVAAMIGNGVYVVLNHYTNNNIHKFLGKETQAASECQQTFYDAITATTELKAMGREKWFLNKSIDAFDRFRKPRMQSIFWRHFRFTTVGLTLTLSMILFYTFGLEMIREGSLKFGTFIGYSFLIGLISRGFSVFFYIIPAQQHALSYAKTLKDFMAIVPEVTTEVDAQAILPESFDIVFKDVSFAYDNGKTIVDRLSLTIPAGQKIAFVGESGCGKSTLLKLIGRFYETTEGIITIGGKDIKHLKPESLRAHMGFVFQETYLFDTTLRENIRFGCLEASEEAVIKASKQACAHEFIKTLSEGYDTRVGERGTRLSGGQKQRIALARMLLKSPKILLLDEATAALDNVTEEAVKQALDKAAQGKTMIAIAHRLSTISHYDHIVVLDSGKIVEQGDYKTLMASKGAFYQLAMRGQTHA